MVVQLEAICLVAVSDFLIDRSPWLSWNLGC